MKYSRDHEREADQLGMDYMVRAGYNPRGLEELMSILVSTNDREPGALDVYFSSHPLSSERLETARSSIGSYPEALKAGLEERERFSRETRYLRSVEPAYEMADEGIELARENRPREARKKFQSAVDMAPNEALLHTYLAALDLSIEDYRQARRGAERALELYPDFFLARMAASRASFGLRDYNSSLSHAAKANELVPDQPGVLFITGRSYEEVGNIPRAARSFYRLLEVMGGRRTEQTQYAAHRLRQWGYIR
jgi:predicted Zn-dependent protease